jgi:UDP-N-acetylglucosamine:LPS N-acetylglucosamine transferase
MTAPTRKILFFTRGRGRGHAIPDLAMLEHLRVQAPEVEWVFASYAAGAATLAEAGVPLVDLQLPDDAPFLEILVRATRTMAGVQPNAVVSHEEFAALPAAHVFRKPVVLLTDFFPSNETRREAIRYAHEVLFIEHQGIFAEPRELAGRVKYLGPVLRPLHASRADRPSARDVFGLSTASKVIAVIPGAWAHEKRAPLFDLVVAAFRALPYDDKRLVWVAGCDKQDLTSRLAGAEDVTLLESCNPVEQLMVASDLVITKANRGTTIDVARLGIPSISLSFGLNPIDEAIIPRLHSNVALDARGVDPAFLATKIAGVLRAEESGSPTEPSLLYKTSAAPEVARAIVRALTGLSSARQSTPDTRPASAT